MLSYCFGLRKQLNSYPNRLSDHPMVSIDDGDSVDVLMLGAGSSTFLKRHRSSP
jgi:hypothetical protein